MTNQKNEPDGKIDTDLLNNALNSLLKPSQMSPPAPRVLSQLPAGMLGYQERKAVERAQADKDREATQAAADPEAKRAAFIAAIKRAFPQVDVHWIAAQCKPWDPAVFKRQVTEAQLRFLENTR